MAVIMTMRFSADARKFEEAAAANGERLRAIADKAKEAGVLAHRFYGSEDGKVMVIDEWPDPESFRSFFESQQGEIGPLMQEAGVTSEPEVTFWRKLETGDEIGWGA
jgi:heme-degrading monooxygenase HmoA